MTAPALARSNPLAARPFDTDERKKKKKVLIVACFLKFVERGAFRARDCFRARFGWPLPRRRLSGWPEQSRRTCKPRPRSCGRRRRSANSRTTCCGRRATRRDGRDRGRARVPPPEPLPGTRVSSVHTCAPSVSFLRLPDPEGTDASVLLRPQTLTGGREGSWFSGT